MKTYSRYLAEIFPDVKKLQKISINAGFSCPNRDGSISTGGCIYCRNDSFSPAYCNPQDSVKSQLEKGKKFFARKYPEMKFLAYFQSYTGTYNKTIEELRNLYYEAINTEDVVGIVIATRPDSLPDEILALLEEINNIKPVFLEIGVETSHDDTLKIINRNHTWKDVVDTIGRIKLKGFHSGIHLILGLPGENKDKILETIHKVINLPIETIKLHQLQVLKDTALHHKILKGEIEVPEFSLDEYLSLCAEIVKIIPENIVVERFISQSPTNLVVSPSWGLKNYEFMAKLAQLIK